MVEKKKATETSLKKKREKQKHNNTNPTGIETNITGEGGAVPGAGGYIPAPSPVLMQGQVLVAAPLRGAGAVHKRLCSPKCLLLPCCHPPHTPPRHSTRGRKALSARHMQPRPLNLEKKLTQTARSVFVTSTEMAPAWSVPCPVSVA